MNPFLFLFQLIGGLIVLAMMGHHLWSRFAPFRPSRREWMEFMRNRYGLTPLYEYHPAHIEKILQFKTGGDVSVKKNPVGKWNALAIEDNKRLEMEAPGSPGICYIVLSFYGEEIPEGLEDILHRDALRTKGPPKRRRIEMPDNPLLFPHDPGTDG